MASGIQGEEAASAALWTAKAALALATLTVGETTLLGMPRAQALEAFADACRGFGAQVRTDPGQTSVRGVGIGGLVRPASPIGRGEDDFAIAVLAGLAAGQDAGAALVMSDAVARELAPGLALTGATIRAAAPVDGIVEIAGARDPLPASHGLLSPAAATAALLAALNAPGTSSLQAAAALPGSLAGLLRLFGAGVHVEAGRVTLRGRPELRPTRLDIDGLAAAAGRPS
ncbi:hypothetical protein [uncultured Alsobacter sp.]|uniref:hypothetical protein n=1 Tax=uncultured Alsobacter sp. TaxID=1748258 RepID=UPI0025FBCBA0|nr:hypothetical protein [uncultured Alsobacter sp.]